ncbi:MAG: hypothetical protein D6800_06115, partial [Candidatus Zixiibacteriota bacterium]
MRLLAVIAAVLVWQTVSAKPTDSEVTYGLDSNVAYFAGEQLDYIIYAPPGFRMVTEEAKRDGYSCAFIPEDQTYDTANIFI